MKHLPLVPCRTDSHFHMASLKVAFPSPIKGSKETLHRHRTYEIVANLSPYSWMVPIDARRGRSWLQGRRAGRPELLPIVPCFPGR